jgi:ankyrin repeat protein
MKKYMKLQEIINSLPEAYDPEKEKRIVRQVKEYEINNLNDELADLLAFAISEKYNELAMTILEKDYNGKKIELENMNKAIISQSQDHYSLLHFTAQFGNKQMLLYFLKNGVKISLDKDKLSPLHSLAFAKDLSKQDYIEIIKELKIVSPDILEQRDAFSLTAFHYAARHDNKPAFEALVTLTN